MSNLKRGKFIIIDGGEGCGKSSQIKKIKEIYGDKIFVTREPGGTPYAEEIRDVILKSPNATDADPKTFSALFWGARRDHLTHKIIPALEEGINVICDRFDSSTYAYQIYGHPEKEERYFWQAREYYLDEYKPDLYIFLSVNPEEGLRRKHSQADELNHFEAKDLDFHKKVGEGLLDFSNKVPSVVIDANNSFEQVSAEIVKELGKIL